MDPSNVHGKRPGELLFFPIPIPGESFYSILARYRRKSGCAFDGQAMKQLFGYRRDLTPTITLPYCAELVDVWLPAACGLTSHELIRRFTAYQYLRLTDLFPEKAFQRIVSPKPHHGRGEQTQMIRALQGEGFKLRYCPDCVIQDTEEYGASCWHLVHQLKAVKYCPVHGTRLLESPWPQKSRLYHWYTAPSVNDLGATRDDQKGDPLRDRYIALGKVIDWLLQHGEKVGPEANLTALYQHELGELTAGKIWKQLETEAGRDFIEELFPGDALFQLALSLIRNDMRCQLPLVHAFLLMTLGGISMLDRYQT